MGQIVDNIEVVIAYAGREFNQAERNYSAMEREALAVIDGIKCFQSHLYDCKFYFPIYHSALKWLMSIQELTGGLAHWSLLIQQFDFEIIHRPGRVNDTADTFSRCPYNTCNINAISEPVYKLIDFMNPKGMIMSLTKLLIILKMKCCH